MITSIGTVFWVLYGSYGIGIMPWMLIKGKKSLEQEKSELENDHNSVKEKFR